jgi:bacillithiol system protein YtxJ
MNWIALDSEDQIQLLKSQNKPSIIFKHSTRCHISNMALKFFEKEWDVTKDVNLYFLDIIANRSISNQVAETFHVHHESPQVLLLKNGDCILDASHQDISAKELEEVLATN